MTDPAIETYLFTDIVGSTEMWDHHPQAMDEAIHLHDEILGLVIGGRGGVIFKNTGDGVCAVFSRPQCGIKAAVEAQRALRNHSWPTAGEALVRVAVHSGTSSHRDGDLMGRDVCLARRLLDMAPGGGLLLTGATLDVLEEGFLDQTWLLDLGEHHLRGIEAPIRVFRLVAYPTGPDVEIDIRSVSIPAGRKAKLG